MTALASAGRVVRPRAAGAARAHGREMLLVCAVSAVLLLIGAWARGIDHDESQYVAAVALMRHGLPFRDFLYLQTPLQPLLLAPFGWIDGAPLLALLRGVNVAAGVAGAAAAMLAAREAGATRGAALAAALLMVTCEPLLFACSVARNDALPFAFECAGIWLLLRARARGEGWAAAGAGLAMAAAASTKISFAIPGAAAAAIMLADVRRLGAGRVTAFAAGALVGLVPTLAFAALYPDAFRFGVLDYGIAAPRQWRALNGEAHFFLPATRIARLLAFLARGPAPVAIALVVWRRWRHPREGGTAALLDALIVAALIAAALPQPTFRQYLVPLLPPLFVRLGMLPIARLGRWWRLAMSAGVAAGLAHTVGDAAAAVRHGSPPLVAARDALWIGARTAGPVASLSPEQVAGAGAAIDPRFATGPFVFRTDRLLAPEEERRFHTVTARGLAMAFRLARPATIVVGGEARRTRAAPHGLDAPLAAWALANGYRPHRSPSGRLTLYLPGPIALQRGFRSVAHAAIALAKR